MGESIPDTLSYTTVPLEKKWSIQLKVELLITTVLTLTDQPWLPRGGQYLTIWGLDSPINCLSPGICFVPSNVSRFVVLYWKQMSAKSVCPARCVMIRARGRRWGILKYVTWGNEMHAQEWKRLYSSKEMCIIREISEGGHITLYLYLVGNSISCNLQRNRHADVKNPHSAGTFSHKPLWCFHCSNTKCYLKCVHSHWNWLTKTKHLKNHHRKVAHRIRSVFYEIH